MVTRCKDRQQPSIEASIEEISSILERIKRLERVERKKGMQVRVGVEEVAVGGSLVFC